MTIRDEFRQLGDELFDEFEAVAVDVTFERPGEVDDITGAEVGGATETITAFRPSLTQSIRSLHNVADGETLIIAKQASFQFVVPVAGHTKITVGNVSGVIVSVTPDPVEFGYNIRARLSG